MELHSLWKVAFLLAVLSPLATSKRLVCYFGSWTVYRTGNGNFSIGAIPTDLCTHVIYSFVGLTAQGQVSLLDSWADIDLGGFAKFAALKTKNPNLKTMVAVGGWNFGTYIFSKIAASPSLITTATSALASFLTKYKFDGLDIDWEYPVAIDKPNFLKLMTSLKTRMAKDGKILTAAVSANTGATGYDIKNLANQVDWINLMTYDYHSYLEGKTGHNAPLIAPAGELSIDVSVKYWVQNGMPTSKIVVGFPLYGQTFTLSNRNKTALGSATSGPGYAGPYSQQAGTLEYKELCALIAQGGWTIVRNTSNQQTYMYKGNQWISYDSVNNAAAKASFANSYGGMMVWEVSADDPNGLCLGGKYPLLNALNKNLT